MTGLNKISCRLCLKTITEKGFQVIDDDTRNILDGFRLKLKLHGDSKDVICNICRRKLDAALEFKSMCLNTYYTIIPYVDCEKTVEFDLVEIYTKNRNEELTGTSYNYKICRLCMELINGEIRSIGNKELESIAKIVPEMNVRTIKDLVLCKSCLDAVNIHNIFIKNCLEVVQESTDNFESSAKGIDTPQALPFDLFIKHEDADNESTTIDEEQMFIKPEYVNIKSEEDEKGSERLLLHLSNETFNSCDYEVAEEEGLKHVLNRKSRSINKCGMKTRENSITLPQFKSDSSLYKCDKCIYETPSKNRVIAYCVKHKKDSEVYKCESCEYVTTKKDLLKRHIVRHKDPSEIQMYTCDKCEFKTKHQRSFARHVGKHKDPSQVRTYACSTCDFVTRYKNNFTVHQLTHKSTLEVEVYKCNDCNFETRHKRSLSNHILRHKDFSQAQLYKCDACEFKSVCKGSISTHQLTHKCPSELPVYRCNNCDYKTKNKGNLSCHVLRHKSPQQVQIYKCEACDFETRHKYNFTAHQLIHKSLSEVRVYGCNNCDYKTKRKRNLSLHVLKHKDPSQVRIYQCDACDYESRYQRNFTKHQLIHRNPSEVHMYRCNDCNYNTKFRRSITSHVLKHKNPSSL